jgi:glyoxylase-like metal-dependent hydrolase (beta-lactamase superfamily II)/rhodanese-related sulfurtransferase
MALDMRFKSSNGAILNTTQKGASMEIKSYTAMDLFNWLTEKERAPFLLLDVRNDVEFGRFKIEGPFPFEMANVPYMEFIEYEDESVAKVPEAGTVRIVCAKEGSAKYVGEILLTHGFKDVAYLTEGIKSWGNLLAPIRVNTDTEYQLFQFRRPGKASCSYGLIHGKEMMVFDPAKNIAAYQSFADERGCAIVKTFETHRQADYISGSDGLRKATGAEIMAPEPDFKEAIFPYTPVADGDVFTFTNGGPRVKTIHTPGHTPGSTCYLIDDKYFISGDTVFIVSIGRPDLGGMAEEWSKLLFNTMTEKVLKMDRSLVVLPGHYLEWDEADGALAFKATLGEIISQNSEIYSISDPAIFFAFIKANMRKQPDEYAKIREINAGLMEVDAEEQDVMDLGKNECAASANPAPANG